MLGLGLGLNKNSVMNQIVRNGLVLYLDGKDFTNTPNTTSWNDRSSNGNNGIPNSFTYTTSSGSDLLGGVVFDGTSDECNAGTGSTMQPSTALSSWTVECTFKTSMTTRGDLIRKYDTNGYDLALNRDGAGSVSLVLGGSVFVISSAIGINDGTKKHVCCSIFNGTQRLFVNGVLIATNNSNAYNITTSASTYIGSIGGANFFNGTIYNARLYNRALTDAEILQNYNASK